MASPLIILIWCIVIAACAFVAIWVTDRTLPAEFKGPARLLIGVIAVVLILLKLTAMV